MSTCAWLGSSLAGGSLIFVAIIAGIFLAVVFGYFTIRGSGIGRHPSSGQRGQAPGAAELSEPSGMGRNPDGADDRMAAGDRFSTRGTR